MKAVIVAAGECKRLRPLTEHLPKCLLPLGGRSLLEYALDALAKYGVKEIALVVGYRREEIKKELGSRVSYLFNPFYRQTNNLASLWCARDFIGGEPFIYCHADLLYHSDILAGIIDHAADICLLVEKAKADDEMMKVKVEGSVLVEMSKAIPQDQAIGEWTGIAKFSARGWQEFLTETRAVLTAGDWNAYDARAFTGVAQRTNLVEITSFEARPFIEIDDENDLYRAQREILPGIS